jgi:hypothetical protein
MSYYIFTKNLPNVSGTLYRIASDQTYLNYITNFPESYNIIQDNIQNFQDVVFGKKLPDKYDDNNIIINDTMNINIDNNRALLNDIVYVIDNKVVNIKKRSQENIVGILYLDSKIKYGSIKDKSLYLFNG